VKRTVGLGRLDESSCFELARALEASSRHPVARAFGGEAKIEVEAPRNFPGQGIEALVEGRRVRIGSEKFCRDLCRGAPQSLQGSFAFLADESGWLAAFELADSLRPTACGFVADQREPALHRAATGPRPRRRSRASSGSRAAPVR
jgi:Cu2+-exporting ATPase